MSRRTSISVFCFQTRQHEDDATMMTESTAATGRFARTAARKSRLTDEWLEVAAQAAEDYRAKVRAMLFSLEA